MMTLELARGILEETAAARKRWGQMSGTGTYSTAQILDALMCLHEAGLFEVQPTKDELTKVKRQLTAAKARYAKLEKRVAKMQQPQP